MFSQRPLISNLFRVFRIRRNLLSEDLLSIRSQLILLLQLFGSQICLCVYVRCCYPKITRSIHFLFYLSVNISVSVHLWIYLPAGRHGLCWSVYRKKWCILIRHQLFVVAVFHIGVQSHGQALRPDGHRFQG